MLEKLLSETSVEEKKRILIEEYGMIMTTELERRMQTARKCLVHRILSFGQFDAEYFSESSASQTQA